MEKNNKKVNLIQLFLSNKYNKNILVPLGDSSSYNSFSPPLSIINHKNNTLTNYMNISSKNMQYKLKSQPIKKSNKLSFYNILNSKSKKERNKDIKSLISCNSMPPKAFLSLIHSKNKKNNKISSLTVEEKNKLKAIIKNFEDNKITTMELYKLQRNNPLNSITKSNFIFLSKENDAVIGQNNKKRKDAFSKIFLTSSNMIGKFNYKTNKILNNFIKDMGFSKNINEFRKQIINSYLDYENRLNEIKKKKSYYNEAINILEECNDKKIKEAQKLEESFYKKKSKSLFRGEPIYLYIKEINNSNTKNNSEIENETLDEKDSTKKYLKNHLICNNYEYMNNIISKRLKTVQSEKTLEESKKKYEKYLRRKFKNTAKSFADSLYNIKDFPEKIRKKGNALSNSNLNMKNLRRVIQVNSIKKNLYSIEDDDLLIKNTKKLREEIKETEKNYYSLFKGKGKYRLDFLKGKIKPSTIQKLNIMKNSYFGIPC